MTQPPNNTSPDNEPPEVETRQVVRWITTPTSQLQRQQPQPPTVERPLRPTVRPPVAVLTILDDGSLETGEDIRIRTERFVIGRESGDLVLPNDRAISASHAEIRRIDNHGRAEWRLVDLGTSNGTFVRVVGGTLYPETVMMLGLRQFQLSPAFAALATAQAADGTQQLDTSAAAASAWPTLVEKTDRDNKLVFPLRRAKVTIGLTGGGCDIEIDDPHLAKHHATIEQNAPGIWTVRSAESINGTWLSLTKAKLTACCFFRCGEQLFRFVLP